MDSLTFSPLPSITIAGDTTKTGSLVPSSNAIMRFLSSKAGPCSAKGLLVGALMIGDSVIPLQAAPVAGQSKGLSLSLDIKNSTSLSIVDKDASCANADTDDTCYSTKIVFSEGSSDGPVVSLAGQCNLSAIF